MSSRALVIGASGQIGGALCDALASRNIAHTGTYGSHPVSGLQHLSIVDADAVHETVERIHPEVIYLTASLSDVDYCEECPSQGYRPNVEGVFHVIQAANRVGALLVYLSSDYVFDGANGPYSEDDPPNPICEYGKQKLISEHLVGLQAERPLIVRTTVVYGPERQGKNFLYRLAGALRQGKEIKVPEDQIGSPTYGPDLAKCMIDLTASGRTGVFHITGPSRCSRYQFALAGARVFGLPEELVRPVRTADLGQRAKRPLNAGLLIDKFISVTGTHPLTFERGLEAMREHLAGNAQTA